MDNEEIKKKLAEMMAAMGLSVEKKAIDPYEGLKNIDHLVENKDIKGLIDVVQHAQTRWLVKQALFALYDVGDKTAIPALLDEALYGYHGLAWREAAVRALGHIGKHEVVEPLIYIMLIGKGSTTCGVVAEVLGEIKDERALKPLTFVMNDPSEENQDAREKAVKALGRIGTEESINTVIAALDSGLSEIASAVLKEVGQPAIEPLIWALVNANENVRGKAATILGEMVLDMKATELLISIIESDVEDASVIKSVVGILGQLGDKSATEHLVAAFKKYLPTNLDLAEEILQALAKMKDPEAVQPLLNAMKPNPKPFVDHDYGVQITLIFALGDIGDKKATAHLLQLLLDNTNEHRVRLDAALALGRICDENAIEPLTAVLMDERDDEGVRNEVFYALYRYPAATAAGPVLDYMKAHPNLVSHINEPSRRRY